MKCQQFAIIMESKMELKSFSETYPSALSTPDPQDDVAWLRWVIIQTSAGKTSEVNIPCKRVKTVSTGPSYLAWQKGRRVQLKSCRYWVAVAAVSLLELFLPSRLSRFSLFVFFGIEFYSWDQFNTFRLGPLLHTWCLLPGSIGGTRIVFALVSILTYPPFGFSML